MNLNRIVFNFRLGMEAILANKTRAFLTSLGIIFGTGAVIAMLSVGAGTEEEILKQMQEAGSNNIIIKPKLPQKKEENNNTEVEKPKFSPGLSLLDVQNISTTLPGIEAISPEIEQETNFLHEGIKMTGKLIGVENDYFSVANLKSESGNFFSDTQEAMAEPVCIIGDDVRAKLFPNSKPVGSYIKCGQIWLKVIGILGEKSVSEKSQTNLSIRNDNNNVYIPIRTFLLRYSDRGRVTRAKIDQAIEENEENEGVTVIKNYHQLDRLVVKVEESTAITESADIIKRMLIRRHNQQEDFEIIIPETLLKQEQRTKQLFNLVLGLIASISLLVGGIGIMNIMLASVMERIREIGLRQSIGATRKDILLQFLAEALSISLAGGVIGIILGISVAFGIEKIAGVNTIVRPASVLLSFSVCLSVGLLFGIFPARKAAQRDPVESLRHD